MNDSKKENKMKDSTKHALQLGQDTKASKN